MGRYAIGIDLGGTKIEAAIVSEEGKILDCVKVPTEATKDAGEIIDKIVGCIETLLKRNAGAVPSAIGIGVAGQVDSTTGMVLYAPNLDWHNVNLGEQLRDKFEIPVAVCNDVRAAAWGEWLVGAGAGCNNLVCMFVGTGVGGAIVSNGKMLDGANNTAGEVGHIIVQMNGPLCHCGNHGCLEALAGGWAIQRDAKKAAKNGAKMLLELEDGNINSITAKTVTTAATKGDPVANEILDNLTEALVCGVTSITNMLGPATIILGGGIIQGNPGLTNNIAAGLKKMSLQAAVEPVKIVEAMLHNDAGSIGAALFALRQFK